MTDHEASRTIVKSPPELWAECSDAAALARHLGEFGEIRITRLEPESAVAWEGELASGTVRIEPSGWGTRVTLTAQLPEADPREEGVAEPVVVPEAPAAGEAEPVAPEAGEADPVATATGEPEPVTRAAGEPEPMTPVAGEPTPSVTSGPATFSAQPPSRPRGLLARLRVLLAPPPPRRPATPEPPAPPVVAAEPVVVAPEPAAAGPPAVAAEPSVAEPARPVVAPEAVVVAPEAPIVEPPPPSVDAVAVLTAALESLGQAHHRPFSRS